MDRNPVHPRSRDTEFGDVNLPLLLVSGGFVVAFCVFGAIELALLTRIVDAAFTWSIRLFGFYWQILVLVVFVLALLIAALPGAGIPLGGLEKPEFSTFKWVAMIFCTLLASGGVFWAAGEPISHFVSPPPYFGDDPKTVEAAYSSLAQTFMHWGFLPWALYGSLTTVMFMVYHYGMGLPLAPRTLLYPLFGKRAIEGPIGLAADASVVLAVVAGFCAAIGFLSLQLGYGLNDLVGTPDTFATHAVVIAVLFAVYTASSVTGVDKGIQILSRVNVVFALILLGFVILVGPSQFILEGYVSGMARYGRNLLSLAFYRESGGLFVEPGWEGSWTMFFWAWYLGWSPMTAIFITRISRGRTVREVVVMLSLIAPLVMTIWFSVLGGMGLALDLADPGAVTGPFEGADLPAALLAITKALPLWFDHLGPLSRALHDIRHHDGGFDDLHGLRCRVRQRQSLCGDTRLLGRGPVGHRIGPCV